jgi:hypothetical protein
MSNKNQDITANEKNVELTEKALRLVNSIEKDVYKFTEELFPEVKIPEDCDLLTYATIAKNHLELNKLLNRRSSPEEIQSVTVKSRQPLKTVIGEKDFDGNPFALLIRDRLRDEVERRKREKQTGQEKRESSKFPEVIPAQTSEEIKYGLRAITDGKTLQHWARSPFETACIHAIPGAPFEIKLFTIDDTETHETLEAIIKEFSSPVAVLFCQFIFNSVLIHDKAHLELDSLIRELGFEVRTTADRQKHRARVFDWIESLSRLGCFGERYKPYYDSFTNKKEKIYSKGRYIYLGDPYFTDEQLLNKERIPTAQTIIAGDWVEQYRGNRKVLQDIGNIRRLAGLPVEQGRGEWALSIALTLLQYWREESASAVIGTVGNDKKPTPRFKKPITRRKLLYTFQPTKFAVDKILKRQNAKRDAIDFWNGALGLLSERDFIAFMGKSRFKNESDLPLRNWQNAWLDEELDIRPHSEARENVFEMIKNVEAAKKRRRKSVS